MQHGHALYEEVMHVPLIVHYPGGRDRGRVRDETVSIVDMLTLVGREVGLELPAGVEGLPLGEREVAWAESPRSAHFVQRYGAEFDRDLSAVVRWPWKLIDAGSGAALVYRLDGDPGEATSLGDAAEVRELRQALAAERSTLRPRARGAKAPELTPEGIEQLRALGYLPR